MQKKNCNEDSKKKERHIVTWTQQEDDILREQINLHGTENWSIIASKFKDKTTRQCRRRWYTYLNSDFKKGGWSPEEDMLLCEAQKIFGNRWTEIAKVVSGRTDNAVKNRFSTLCKKRAKYEALAKENPSSYINSNKKRILYPNELTTTDGSSETTTPSNKIRRTDIKENGSVGDRSHKQCGTTMNQKLRAPFAVLIQNFHNVAYLPAQPHVSNAKKILNDDQSTNIECTFLKKDDPKRTALVQQAELLSSLAEKVNTENTDQSLENAWKVLKDFLNHSKDSNMLRQRVPDDNLQLEDIKNLVEDVRSSNEVSNWRQPDLHDSPGSSEYSSGSTPQSQTTEEQKEQNQHEKDALHNKTNSGPQSTDIGEHNGIDDCDNEILSAANLVQEVFQCCNEQAINDATASASSSTAFSSPLQVTPIFRSLAAGIPSPVFSESERNFLLKTLGESPSLYSNTNPSQPPACKRALLRSL